MRLYTGFTIRAKEGAVAQRVTVELTDDIDGTEAAETIAFRVDGTAYEIDLSKIHTAKVRFRQEDLTRCCSNRVCAQKKHLWTRRYCPS
jgi:hypothetical protein